MALHPTLAPLLLPPGSLPHATTPKNATLSRARITLATPNVFLPAIETLLTTLWPRIRCCSRRKDPGTGRRRARVRTTARVLVLAFVLRAVSRSGFPTLLVPLSRRGVLWAHAMLNLKTVVRTATRRPRRHMCRRG